MSSTQHPWWQSWVPRVLSVQIRTSRQNKGQSTTIACEKNDHNWYLSRLICFSISPSLSLLLSPWLIYLFIYLFIYFSFIYCLILQALLLPAIYCVSIRRSIIAWCFTACGHHCEKTNNDWFVTRSSLWPSQNNIHDWFKESLRMPLWNLDYSSFTEHV